MSLFNSLKQVLTPYANKIKMLEQEVETLNDGGLNIEEEFLASTVSDWLDEHPEVTTTIQDGSITKAKLASDLKRIEYVSNYSELLATTADEVVVLNDDSYYGNGQTVTYMRYTHDWNSNTYGYQRTNGTVVVPKPRKDTVFSKAPMTSIGDVIGSYLNHPELVYPPASEEPKCAFDTICQDQMDCSTFVYLAMQGIDYDHSRYAGNTENIKGWYAGNNVPVVEQSKSTSRKAFNASEIALFYAARNRLFYINYDVKQPVGQLQPGDILFWSDYSNARTHDRYLGIHHIAVIVETYPGSDTVMIAQAGSSDEYYIQPIGASNATNNCNLALVELTNLGECLTYARPNYGFENEPIPEQVIKYAYCTEGETPAAAGQRSVLSEIYFKKPLNKDKVYTLSVKGILPFEDKQSLILSVFTKGDYNLYNIQCKNLSFKDEITIPFVPRSDVEDITDFWLCAWYPTGREVSTTEYFNVIDIAIYEGLVTKTVPICSDKKNAVVFNTDSQEGTVTIATTQDRNGRTMPLVRCWKEANNLQLYALLKLKQQPVSNGFITIGQINPDVITFPTMPIERFYRVRGVPRVLRISSNGNVEAWVTTDDVADTTLYIDVVI